jgi:putative ABC transport system ATP-binding protein
VTQTATSNGPDDDAAANASDQHGTDPRPVVVMLETRHLSRNVGQRLLVQDVSVQVSAGQIFAVVGPSGAG